MWHVLPLPKMACPIQKHGFSGNFVSSGNAGSTTLSFSRAIFNICILLRSLSLAFALRILLSLWTSVGLRFEDRPLPARLERRNEERRSMPPPLVDLQIPNKIDEVLRKISYTNKFFANISKMYQVKWR